MATACSSPFTATRARSALCAAKSRERGEVPACTSGRCPCTGRATFSGPVDAEVLAVEVGGVELGRIEEHAGRGIRHDRIVLERVPEPAQHVLELDDAVVARLVRGVEVLAVVARRARLGSGHQVQPGAPAREQVDRGRGARERVRVGVAGVRGRDQADALGDAREVRDRRDRVDARHEVRVAELEVVPRGQPVAEEQVVEPRGLGHLARRGGARRRRRAGRDGRPAYRQPDGYAPIARTIAPMMSRVMCSTSRLPTLGRASGCREGRRHTTAPAVTRVNGASRDVIARGRGRAASPERQPECAPATAQMAARSATSGHSNGSRSPSPTRLMYRSTIPYDCHRVVSV